MIHFCRKITPLCCPTTCHRHLGCALVASLNVLDGLKPARPKACNLSRQIEQVKGVAKTIKEHWSGILAWFDSKLSNGYVEAVNGLIQAAKRRALGYKTGWARLSMANKPGETINLMG